MIRFLIEIVLLHIAPDLSKDFYANTVTKLWTIVIRIQKHYVWHVANIVSDLQTI